MSEVVKPAWLADAETRHLQAIACDHIVPFRVIAPSAKPKPICDSGLKLDGSEIVEDQHRASDGSNGLGNDVV